MILTKKEWEELFEKECFKETDRYFESDEDGRKRFKIKVGNIIKDTTIEINRVLYNVSLIIDDGKLSTVSLCHKREKVIEDGLVIYRVRPDEDCKDSPTVKIVVSTRPEIPCVIVNLFEGTDEVESDNGVASIFLNSADEAKKFVEKFDEIVQ